MKNQQVEGITQNKAIIPWRVYPFKSSKGLFYRFRRPRIIPLLIIFFLRIRTKKIIKWKAERKTLKAMREGDESNNPFAFFLYNMKYDRKPFRHLLFQENLKKQTKQGL